MKKIVSLALAVLLVLSLAACGSKNSGTGDVSDALTLLNTVWATYSEEEKFPVSGGDKYIALLDEEGIEQAIIRDLDTLLPESQAVIREALEEYYLIPKITRVNDATERYGIKWWVETDRGPCEFQIRLNTDIKVFYDNRVMIRDVNDNRYEIPDYTKLDKHSLHVLGTQI